MNATQWERAKKIFDDALDRPQGERAEFVRESCAGDATLLQEVENLLAADEAAGSFLSHGWAGAVENSEFSLAVGDVVCERFRIDRALGNGGMGRVYQAFDLELQAAVALKVLRPEIASDPELLRRFRQEVRIAHRITHPNVCRTFHLDREVRQAGPRRVEITFLTMEFLRGETLQQMLARDGAMAPAVALGIARQMAAAIDAAHKTGIVHRDIKPANVMVCPELSGEGTGERAVITDFGLAKLRSDSATREESTISVPGRVMGTLAYMAPEQLQASESTPATDIYAFGLVLFEMVVGAKAFPNSQSVAAAFGRLTQEAPSAKAAVPGLPHEWDAAIRACLEVDPAARPASAGEVLAILEKEVTARRRRSSRRWHVPAGVAAGILLLMSLLWLGLRTYGWRADSAVASGTLVYLAPVANQSGEKRLDNVSELLRGSLSQSAHINLLNAGKVGALLEQMGRPLDAKIDPATAREIAMRAGAARVLFVTLRRDGSVTRMDVDLEQPDNTPSRYRNHWTESFSWTTPEDTGSELPQGLMVNVRAAGNWVRKKVGESSSDIARLDTPPEDVTTRNWEALADFTEANKLAAAARNEDAVVLLKKAVAQDPGFAFAYGRLGELLFSLDRPEEGYAAYNKALDESLSSRLTRRERDLIKGTYAVDTLDFASAEEAFRDCAAYYESDNLCLYSQAYPLQMLGRMEDAIALIERLTKSGGLPHGAPSMLAYDYMLLGDLPSAKKQLQALLQRGQMDEAGYIGGHIAFLEGKLTEAERDFLTMQEKASDEYTKSESYTLLANLAAEQGHAAQALEIFTAGIQSDRAHGLRHGEAFKHLGLAYLYSRAGRVAPCLQEVDAALELDAGPDAVVRAAATVGFLTRGPDARTRALLVRELRAMQVKLPLNTNAVIYELARHAVAAEIALAEGKPEAAVAEYKAADVIDSPITSREGLARAYSAAAAVEKPGEARDRMLSKAAEAYERVALRPAFVWYSAQRQPPGFYADEVQDFLSLPMHSADGKTTMLRTRLDSLRAAGPVH
jgi:serine/threonine protein kinase/tetratricopeptide (TPR) repeat protein